MCHWFYHASYCMEKDEPGGAWRPREYFVQDLFSPDCGVFHTVLDMPLIAWAEKMDNAATNTIATGTPCSQPFCRTLRLYSPDECSVVMEDQTMASGKDLQECAVDIEDVPPADSGDQVDGLIILWSTVDFFNCLRMAVLHLVNKALMPQ
ncbi:hypothetical protein KOW79_008478 [Hemibagrus wyckioides]|uniref:Uncharacterized protein n=1 Tax=Hemibagrus wyckioides TaxID=337641 RepID=A0A9D3SQZ2_9TELE|nr:hypothetical protein KOW79_008478 [Hemibagrus wyckioides]